jgi:hypothetical protein
MTMQVASARPDPEFSDITVVIPTTGGRRTLDWMLRYWSDIGIAVVVAERPKTPRESNPHREFVCRIATAVKATSTRFVAIIGDDDVYTPSGLRESLRLLKLHPETEYVVGRTLYWHRQRESFRPAIWSCRYREAYTSRKPFHDGPATSALERMSRRSIFPLWSITRRQPMLRYLDLLARTGPRDPRLAENVCHLQGRLLMFGACLDRLLWVRHEKTPHDRTITAASRLDQADYAEWEDAMMSAVDLCESGSRLGIEDMIHLRRPKEGFAAGRNWQIRRRCIELMRSVPSPVIGGLLRALESDAPPFLGLPDLPAKEPWFSPERDGPDLRLFERAVLGHRRSSDS